MHYLTIVLDLVILWQHLIPKCSDSPTISLGTHNISDTDIKTKLKEIQGAEVDTQFQNILLTLPEPSSAVITKFKVQFSEKNVYSKCLSPW